MTHRTARIDWPDFGSPDLPPPLTLLEMRGRMAAIRAAMTLRALDVVFIYGDREHAANLQWATGFDPRFEEAFLIVTPDGGVLATGNECLPYTGISPLVAAGDVAVVHCPSLSLPSQPRGGVRIADLIGDAVPAGANVGAAGWKWFGADEVDTPETALDLPAFLADPLRARAGSVINATDMFMSPATGLRSTVDAVGIARLEFANHMAAAALRRMVFAFREGMSDFEAVQIARIGGLPLGCHTTFATGGRAAQGLSGPTGEVLTLGSPISFNVCHWGANICRAGWVARGPGDLPAPAADYIDAFVGPYVAALSDWCALMRPGVAGAAVWDVIQAALPGHGITLNPGHLIGLDEWISSPIYAGSEVALRSGMAMQCDVIPDHPIYGSTRMEDGYVIADNALKADLTARFPAVAQRVAQRQAFIRDVIGMDVPDTLLPLADTCGIVAPWLLDPAEIVVLL